MSAPRFGNTDHAAAVRGRWLMVVLLLSTAGASADDFTERLAPFLGQYCSECHGEDSPEGNVDLVGLVARRDIGGHFRQWRKVAQMLGEGRMPPQSSDQPTRDQRRLAATIIRAEIDAAAKRSRHDPGAIVMRRLTSAEYAYSIRDLTGLELDFDHFVGGDAAGGEGFSNTGVVQFVEDATLEGYLAAAKQVANHAVIGTGPLHFFPHPGKTGFELSAIDRIQAIYRAHGFRAAAGEGGEAFGLDRYARAFFVAWRFRCRADLGQPTATLAELAAAENVPARFAEYIWELMHNSSLTFPTSEIAQRWREIPRPQTPDDVGRARSACRRIHALIVDWQKKLGQNADAKEEAPVLAADSFDVRPTQVFTMNVNWPEGTEYAHLKINVESATGRSDRAAVIRWLQPTIQFRLPDRRPDEPQPLLEVIEARIVKQLERAGDDGDFVTRGDNVPLLRIPIPPRARSAKLAVTAALDTRQSADCIVRCTIAQLEETDQGKFVSAVFGDPDGASFEQWKQGVVDFATRLPQVSHREPAPSDRDPIPPAFDNTYNNAERNHFHYLVKYYRRDRFFVENVIDPAVRISLDEAWTDLHGSFEYFDAYWRLLADKHGLTGDRRELAPLTLAGMASLPEPLAKIARDLKHRQHAVTTRLRGAQQRHVGDVQALAARAWRRSLTADEQARLSAYYEQLRSEGSDHRQAIRALIARVLVAPAFIYRLEPPAPAARTARRVVAGAGARLAPHQIASRLSYFLWSSVPDRPLLRAASAGELDSDAGIRNQARRMLRHPKAKRLAAEFFGQWLGFYQFDEFQGIDRDAFPEFTDQLKVAMHDEAVQFFEYLIRNNRPTDDILFADYVFASPELAQHYGLPAVAVAGRQSAAGERRGGILGFGAILAATSAPRRTSPVKRGDWVLRRILGTPVPPPPADAGSIPADEVLADGLTVRQRLEAHRRDASCNSCHARIDPLGFALENFDAIGRWRDRYADGQSIDASSQLHAGPQIAGVAGLRRYLGDNTPLFRRTLCTKLVGYALGRGESINDVQLIERMMAQLAKEDRFGHLVEEIVVSPQFLRRRLPTPVGSESRSEALRQ